MEIKHDYAIFATVSGRFVSALVKSENCVSAADAFKSRYGIPERMETQLLDRTGRPCRWII